MVVTFCDGCGKQLNRYDKSNGYMAYQILKGFDLQDKDGKTQGCATQYLDFCTDCYTKIEAFLNDMVSEMPDEFDTHVKTNRTPIKESD